MAQQVKVLATQTCRPASKTQNPKALLQSLQHVHSGNTGPPTCTPIHTHTKKKLWKIQINMSMLSLPLWHFCYCPLPHPNIKTRKYNFSLQVEDIISACKCLAVASANCYTEQNQLFRKCQNAILISELTAVSAVAAAGSYSYRVTAVYASWGLY